MRRDERLDPRVLGVGGAEDGPAHAHHRRAVLRDDLLERWSRPAACVRDPRSCQAGLAHRDAQPARAAGRARRGRCRRAPSARRGRSAGCGPPNTSRSPERSSTSVNGRGAAVDAGHAEHARVAEADGDHRRRRRLLAVLVQAEPGAGRVQVDDRRVGLERLAGSPAPNVSATARRARSTSSGGQRLHRRAVGVVGGAASRRTAASASRGTPTARSSGGRSGTRGWRSPAGGTRPLAELARPGRAARAGVSQPATWTTSGSGRVVCGAAGDASEPGSSSAGASRPNANCPTRRVPGAGNEVGTPPRRLLRMRPRADGDVPLIPGERSSHSICEVTRRGVAPGEPARACERRGPARSRARARGPAGGATRVRGRRLRRARGRR